MEDRTSDFLKSWQVYEYLARRSVDGSETSRLMHVPGIDTSRYISGKVNEETKELADALHESRDRFIEEGHQVWYWTTLLCIRYGLKFDDVKPDETILGGYGKGLAGFRGIPVSYVGTKDNVKESTTRTFDYMGRACSVAKVDPLEIIRYDLHEMQTKPYLQQFFSDTNG